MKAILSVIVALAAASSASAQSVSINTDCLQKIKVLEIAAEATGRVQQLVDTPIDANVTEQDRTQLVNSYGKLALEALSDQIAARKAAKQACK